MKSEINALTRKSRGLSTDVKPTAAAGADMAGMNGSTFYEINTGKQFIYDEENDQWLPDKTAVGASWGNITGDINDQADLAEALDDLVPKQQSTTDAGKVLGIGDDGMVTPVDRVSNNGYYYEGAFYKDAEHTELIEPKEGSTYLDVANLAIYIYQDGAYTDYLTDVKTALSDLWYTIKGSTASEIQQEINTHAGSAKIVFVKKTYELADSLTIPDGAYVDFSGAVIKRKTNVHNVVVVGNNTVVRNLKVDGNYEEDSLTNNNPAHRFFGVFINSKKNVLLENIEVYGTVNGETQPEGTNAGVVLIKCENITIHKMYGHDNCGTALFGYGDTNNIRDCCDINVSDSFFENNGGSGISGYFTRANFVNCIAKNNGITIEGQYSSNFTGISINGIDNNVANCISEGNTGAGFTLGHDTAAKRLSMVNCTAFGNNLDGVYINAEHFTASNCVFYNNTRRNIQVNDAHAIGTFVNCYVSGIAGNLVRGLYTLFTGCHFENASTGEQIFGIVFFRDCEFVNDCAATGGYGFITANNACHLYISGCYFRSDAEHFTSNAVMLVAGSNTVMTDCIFHAFSKAFRSATGANFRFKSHTQGTSILTGTNGTVAVGKDESGFVHMSITASGEGHCQLPNSAFYPSYAVSTPVSITNTGYISWSSAGNYNVSYYAAAGFDNSNFI